MTKILSDALTFVLTKLSELGVFVAHNLWIFAILIGMLILVKIIKRFN